MSDNKTIIVFARPLKLGAVKKRLAGALGDEKALQIYSRLMEITMKATRSSGVDTIVYFSAAPEYQHDYINNIQRGADLGEKMANALSNEINHSRGLVCLVGSDCPDISSAIINKAMDALTHYDVVLGPAADGGYYLIGMKTLYQPLFVNISWGEDTVLARTLSICEELGLTTNLLPTLKDVDLVEDLPDGW
jgi:rSAM/selenodomain-associated transferase 1